LLTIEREACAQKRENVFLHPKKFYKKFFPKLRIKQRPLPDTLYIKTYPNFLSVRMHLLSPSITVKVRPGNASRSAPDQTSNFKTNIGDIIGFTANYRFVSAGFAVVLKSGLHSPSGYAMSQYRTATIRYASNAYMLQYKYLRSRGFTDINHASVKERFTQRPDMVNKEFQFEGLYNFDWKKYSYIAPFSFSHRQAKSRAGLLLKAGVYYTQISGDSTLINPAQEKYYQNFNDIHAVRTFSVKVAPGAGATFVLKNYYFSVAAFPSYDLYFYKFINAEDKKVSTANTFVVTVDCKANVGYQSKRFYAGIKYEIERRDAFLRVLDSRIMYSYIGLEFGYRFRTPRVVKKVYKETMPPGM
jgi:hypothetical protein